MSYWNRWAVLCIAFAVLGTSHARAFDVWPGIGFVAITNAFEHDEFVLGDAAQQEIGRGLPTPTAA